MSSPTNARPATVLADADKRALKTTILELRRLLEADIAKQLRRLGIDGAKPAPVDASSLSYLTADEVEARTVLDGVLAKERLAVSGYAAAVEAVLREAVYTHLNRLVGLKCLELRGHLTIDGETSEAVTCRPEFGGRSRWLWTLRDREEQYRHGEDAEERLWHEGLTLACAAVSEQIRILFDPADPYAQVWPSYRALRDTVDALNGLPEDVFRADETLGWVYQYFQTDEKARVLEEERTKKRNTGWPDIIPRTSLYTERYMVDFLLQNSLGALWMEMYPDSPLAASWPYYVKPATPYTREPKPVKQWRLLDPAEGSGHFLVVAFDLFRQLYAEERRLAAEGKVGADWVVPEEEVAATILSENLHGIDIDPRSVQISALALWLKAREAGLSAPPRLNLVVADCVLGEGEAYEQLLAKHADRPLIQEAIRTIWRSLQNVRELGSLIRVEEELAEAVEEIAKRDARGRPMSRLWADWESLRHELLQDLRGTFKAEAQTQDVGHRLFGAEGQKGLDLVETLSARYDVVCTNPPYLGAKTMTSRLKDHVTKKYSPGKRDLYAAFLLRCLELSSTHGCAALVTQHSWMFLQSYVALRGVPARSETERSAPGFRGVLREAVVSLLAHLGPGSFSEISGEVVNTVLVLARRIQPTPSSVVSALRCTGGRTPAEKVRGLEDAIRTDGVYRVAQSSFLRIPNTPILYWHTSELLRLFAEGTPLEEFIDIRQGMATSDNARFLRFNWEVLGPNRGWKLYAKGGGYRKWCGYEYLSFDFREDGRRFREFEAQKFAGTDWDGILGRKFALVERYADRQAVVYTQMASGSLGPRFWGGGFFDVKSIAVFEKPGAPMDLGQIAAILATRYATFMLRSLTQNLEFHAGYTAMLPVPSLGSAGEALSRLARAAHSIKAELISEDPTELVFREVVPTFDGAAGGSNPDCAAAVLHTIEGELDSVFLRAAGLGVESRNLIVSETGSPVSWNPLIAGYDAPPSAQWQVEETSLQLPKWLAGSERLHFTMAQLLALKHRLSAEFGCGPAADAEGDLQEDDTLSEAEPDESESLRAAYLPVPAETPVERLARNLEIHPVSVYWLLEELRRDEGLVCPPELMRHTEDYFSVKLLRMLGHRWPMQDQYETEEGRPFIDPDWVDEDGIIPLTGGTGEETLAERFSRFLDVEFGAERGHAVELEAGQILGWKPGDEWGKQTPTTLARWLERDFFKRHVSQFKKRPIAWHLSSPRGTFQVIAYYHKLDRNRLQLLRSRYVRHCIDDLRRQLGAAQAATPDRQTLARIADLETRVADVEAFESDLGRLLEGRDREARIWCPWKKPEEQPGGWNPDVNDGVRVNIAPVQRLGLLAADVLAKKDLASLLAPEGRR